MARLPSFDKYAYYHKSVQDVEVDLDFIERVFRQGTGRKPHSFGEDFCGTFALSCGWVLRGKDRFAVGVDLDPVPIRYGVENYLSPLPEATQKRLRIFQTDVADPRLPRVDVIAALNFSYFIFKERVQLLRYFKNTYRRLEKKGLLIVDCFGGAETLAPVVDETPFRGFTYFWDQVSFNPISHEALFYIHFKRPGEKKRERVFRYDWRMWTLPELQDLMKEAGFRESRVYWEGSNTRGGGNGIFKHKTREDSCPAWLCYVIGYK